MAASELILAITAAVLSAAALLFAILQTTSAISQYLASINRCGRAITGAFELRQGFFRSLITFTLKPRYRMPVLTMPGLRSAIPLIERENMEIIPLQRGQNFDPALNSYLDGKTARIAGPQRSLPISYRRTLWAINMKSEAQTAMSKIKTSPTPGLEAASWVQFLINYQATWWGHANLRWEWRLASLIPADMYGACAQTTMADLELLATLGGMHFSDSQAIIGRTLCGEQLTVSQHGVLGPTVYYRSSRDNVRAEIKLSRPMFGGWLLHSVAARRMVDLRPFLTGGTYANRTIAMNPSCKIDAGTISSLSAERVVKYLSRERTIFDAQLSYSCGNATWALATQDFQTYSQTLLEHLSTPTVAPSIDQAITTIRQTAPSAPTHEVSITSNWAESEIAVFWGPLGSGNNFCSCTQCCRDWYTAATSHIPATSRSSISELLACGATFWAALDVEADGKTVGPMTLVVPHEFNRISDDGSLPTVTVKVQNCCRGIQGRCCDTIARLMDDSDPAPCLDQVLAVVALNTRWLATIPSEKLLLVAEELVFGRPSGNASTPDIETLKNVVAYTEKLLVPLRQRIGSADVWNSPLGPTLEDFSPVALGA